MNSQRVLTQGLTGVPKNRIRRKEEEDRDDVTRDRQDGRNRARGGRQTVSQAEHSGLFL